MLLDVRETIATLNQIDRVVVAVSDGSFEHMCVQLGFRATTIRTANRWETQAGFPGLLTIPPRQPMVQ